MAQKKINFINLKSGDAFLLDAQGKISPSKTEAKKVLTASRLAYNDIIIHSFKLDKVYKTPQELTLAVEMKMYEDLALDLQKEYRIFYIEKPTEVGDILLIEAFAYDKNAILEKYAATFKKIRHLDFLAHPVLAFETIYTHEDVPRANDAFIYIGDEEAFLTFYKEGAYVSSKKLKSLQEMCDELDTKGIRLTIDELKEALRSKGVCKENYTLFEYDLYEYIHDTFDRIFSTIKNLALHNRNIYNFAQLDHVYLRLGDGIIPELPLLAAGYLESTQILPINLYKEHSAYDFLDLLSAHYVQDYTESGDEAANLTFYKKKIPFYHTQTGRFAIAAAAGILLAFAYPAWQQYTIYQLEQENETLQQQLDTLRQSSRRLERKYASVKKEIAHYTKAKQEVDRKFTRLRHIADRLLTLKSKDDQYTTMLLTINDLLHKYGLTVDKVTQTGEKSLDIEIYSRENRRDTIALFMKDLLSEGFSKVTSNEITLSDDAYKSVVTVKR